MSPATKIYPVILILLLVGATNAKQDIEQSQIVGVSIGDNFTYHMYGYFSSDNPDLVIDVPPFEANNTEWVRIEITNVEDTIIYHTYILNFYNGSQQTIKGQTSLVDNSEQSQDFRGVPICPANLKKGEIIPTLPLKINNTIMWNYPQEQREVNYAQWSIYDDFGICYFDKKTGMLLDMNRTHLYTNPTSNQTIAKTDIIKIINTNVWNMQPTNLLPIIAITILISALILVYLIRKNSKLKRIQKHQQNTVFNSISQFLYGSISISLVFIRPPVLN